MEKDNTIKENIKKRYGAIALQGNSDSCCMPSSSSSSCCESSNKVVEFTKSIGYDAKELAAIPQSSILGVGCGSPTKFAHIKQGDIVVDLGSGAGIDVFLAANIVKDKGRVIGIDKTDEMIKKAEENAQNHGYRNVEFRKSDIEKRIPVEDNSVDVVISNCVINLTSSKEDTFKEVYRVLKPNGTGKMVISDLVTSREMDKDSVNSENWCSCIDGALTRENYIGSIKKAGFNHVEILDEKPYLEMEDDSGDDGSVSAERRKITSLTIKAVK
jgi:arsenite methyltransferase